MTLVDLMTAMNDADTKMNAASCALSRVRAMAILMLAEQNGTLESREARLARVLITEPWDPAAYDAVLNESREVVS